MHSLSYTAVTKKKTKSQIQTTGSCANGTQYNVQCYIHEQTAIIWVIHRVIRKLARRVKIKSVVLGVKTHNKN